MKYLCLDIGNVLVNQDMEPFVKALSKQMNISKDEVFHFLNRIQRKQDLGITSIRDEISTHFNIKSEYILDDLINAWHWVVEPNWQSIGFMNQLISKYEIKVALLSNLGFEHMGYFDNKLQDMDVYNKSIHHFSCEIGARKPTVLYYKTFLDLHPEFTGAVYVDDLHENLKTGEHMGLKSFHMDLSKHVPPHTYTDTLSPVLTRLEYMLLGNK